ncbi:MAG: hypothetical protein AAGD38_24075, partial [Acidobacteriota bacterium]
MYRRFFLALLLLFSFPFVAQAQPLLKSAVNVDAGNTKDVGQTFGYRLTYNCSNTSGPCLGAEVIDLLPAEVDFVDTVPASPTGDVALIEVTPNFGGTGRTRVRFDLIDPLPAGNSGDLLINVRFPNGSTPDDTVATNEADGINLETTAGTFTTPPVDVTAVAMVDVDLSKTLLTNPALLDQISQYRLRIRVPNSSGVLQLDSVGPVTDTLPPGAIFQGANPVADCEPGCIGTTPTTITWASPCNDPVTPNENCDIIVDVEFPSATFMDGEMVTNTFVATATPLGEPSQGFGPGTATHPVEVFTPNPSINMNKVLASGTPNPPTTNQTFSYDLQPSNNGNVPIENGVLLDDLPIEFQLDSVRGGAYNDFAGGTVEVAYETNLSAGFVVLGTSATDVTYPAPALAAGEYVTRLRWRFLGIMGPDFSGSPRPRVTGTIINPDNAGSPVNFGDSITNCTDFDGVYDPSGVNTPVSDMSCRTFTLSGPFVRLFPDKDRIGSSGPFAPGQTVQWRLEVESDGQSSDAIPLEDLVITDLLPIDLIYTPGSWSFNDPDGNGLPAPQVFEEIPNFAGSGRTLLRWRWNAGSGAIPTGDEVHLFIDTTIREGASFGTVTNTFGMDLDNPGLSQRCRGTNSVDSLDLDGDSDTTENRCTSSASATVAPIAQLVSSKEVQALCDPGFTDASAGVLIGGNITYELSVQNVGTVPMEDFV